MESKILCLETSTEVCSVVLVSNGGVVDVLEDASGMNHSKMLTQFITDILQRNNIKTSELDAIAVTEGPGSYTGLRIGVSAAKGLCYGAGVPMIAVSPLEAMANAVIVSSEIELLDSDILLPMIDARRMEVYTEKIDAFGNILNDVEAVVVAENSFDDLLLEHRILYFGNGAAKCCEVLTHSNAVFIDGITTSAVNMVKIATEKLEQKNFVDVAYFEPFYLKNFIATKAKNSVLDNL